MKKMSRRAKADLQKKGGTYNPKKKKQTEKA